MTVQQLLANISSLELAEWMLYYNVDPFGNDRQDLQAGIIASTIANANSGKGKTYAPADFMPYTEQTEQSPDDMKAMLNTIAGGK